MNLNRYLTPEVKSYVDDLVYEQGLRSINFLTRQQKAIFASLLLRAGGIEDLIDHLANYEPDCCAKFVEIAIANDTPECHRLAISQLSRSLVLGYSDVMEALVADYVTRLEQERVPFSEDADYQYDAHRDSL